MDVLFRNGPSTVAEVKDRLPDGLGYSAVRALPRILEEKGHARHEKVGPRLASGIEKPPSSDLNAIAWLRDRPDGSGALGYSFA